MCEPRTPAKRHPLIGFSITFVAPAASYAASACSAARAASFVCSSAYARATPCVIFPVPIASSSRRRCRLCAPYCIICSTEKEESTRRGGPHCMELATLHPTEQWHEHSVREDVVLPSGIEQIDVTHIHLNSRSSCPSRSLATWDRNHDQHGCPLRCMCLAFLLEPHLPKRSAPSSERMLVVRRRVTSKERVR